MKLLEKMMQIADCRLQNNAKRRLALPPFSIQHSVFFFGLVCVLMISISCSHDSFNKRTVIPEAVWAQENRIAFDIEIDDTINGYEFGIEMRHLETYRYRNLFVFLHTTFPNGNLSCDTIECILATPEGQWIGKGSGSMRDLTIPLNEGLRFPLPGTYHFEIEQAMREPKLKGIADIGLYIEKL